jgi:hypothetical protein
MKIVNENPKYKLKNDLILKLKSKSLENGLNLKSLLKIIYRF